MREARSFCRICTGFCATRVQINDAGEIAAVHGDREDPVHNGYICFKGVHAHEAMHSPGRLLHPLARSDDGELRRIETERALDQIADRLRKIIEQHGPEAVGMFVGNGGFPHSASAELRFGFLDAIGSNARFTSATIDVGAQFVLAERLGYWAGGKHQLADSDVGLIFGSNPLVSHNTSGIVDVDPTKRLKRARAAGYKLIVVDPRRSETARNADVFVQPRPGQDTAIAAAVLRVILEEGWHDHAFCERYVGGDRLVALMKALAPFTPEMAARRAGIEPYEIRAIAQTFARDGKRGIAYVMTGVNMGPQSNLAAHMIECLNVICGRFKRVGETYRDFNPMAPAAPRTAEVVPAGRWASQQRSRIRGYGLANERNSGTLAAEILTPGKGQIRALFVMGGNPANSVPDQRRIVEALKSLDLLVVTEAFKSNTARLAHYVMPAYMMYERADVSLNLYGGAFFPLPLAQYTPALVEPPEGSELVPDWYMLWGVARRLGLEITVGGTPLDLHTSPTEDELFTRMMASSSVDFATLKATDGSLVLDGGTPRVVVPPNDPDSAARFDVMPDDVAEELAKNAAASAALDPAFSHLLIGRRMPRIYNTHGSTLHRANAAKRNMAYLHPDDFRALGLQAGDKVSIGSDVDSVVLTAEADETMRAGVVAVSHGWGGLPGENDDERGASVNRLISDERDLEEINSMPRMTAIPVKVEKFYSRATGAESL